MECQALYSGENKKKKKKTLKSVLFICENAIKLNVTEDGIFQNHFSKRKKVNKYLNKCLTMVFCIYILEDWFKVQLIFFFICRTLAMCTQG